VFVSGLQGHRQRGQIPGKSIPSAAATAAAVTTAATVTAAAATATTAATAAAAAVATAATTIFARFGLIHGQTPAIVLLIVKPLDGSLCLGFGVHFDKAEALTPARGAVLDYLRTLDGTELREQLFQRGVAD
jgi:tetrahydromethanopterin S-methyltransferase subunit D